ncbi:unnamed protein product [Lepidochelys olivacea]
MRCTLRELSGSLKCSANSEGGKRRLGLSGMVQTWSCFHFVDRYVEWSTCGCVATCVSACQSILLLSLGTKKDPSLEAEDPWVGVKGQPIVLRERVRNGLTSEEQEGHIAICISLQDGW